LGNGNPSDLGEGMDFAPVNHLTTVVYACVSMPQVAKQRNHGIREPPRLS